MKHRRLLFTSIILAYSGCSAWIEDFELGTVSDVEDETNAGTEPSDTMPHETDSESNEPDNCGLMFPAPAGGSVELCVVEGGTYRRGCDPTVANENCGADEQPAHAVTLTRFQMMRHEVSRSLYGAFLAANPKWRKGGDWAVAKCDTRYLNDWKTDAPAGGTEELPVVQVCWYAAQAFCEWLGPGFGLPSEAQWEAAARGVHDGMRGPYWIFSFGNDASCDVANYETCGRTARTVTGAGGDSSLNLRGMAGNAWEWVKDWYRPDTYCDPDGLGDHIAPSCDTTYSWTDPEGDVDGTAKALRGGSFGLPITELRNAARSSLSPNISSDFSGLRCARLAP